MAKLIRPTQLEKKNEYEKVIRQFAMKCTPSARVDNFSIRKANSGLLVRTVSQDIPTKMEG